ncbi:hypothetical protein [Caudoviricetes sp.]|nr:hypothetical protein [Caudoviricetes sp.]
MATRRRNTKTHPSPTLISALNLFADLGMKSGDPVRFRDGWADFRKDDLIVRRRCGETDLDCTVDGHAFRNVIAGLTEPIMLAVRETELQIVSGGEAILPLLPREETPLEIAVYQAVPPTLFQTIVGYHAIAKLHKVNLTIAHGQLWIVAPRYLVWAQTCSIKSPPFAIRYGDLAKLKKVKDVSLGAVGMLDGMLALFFGDGPEDPNATVFGIAQSVEFSENLLLFIDSETGGNCYKVPSIFWESLESLAQLAPEAIGNFCENRVELYGSTIKASRPVPTMGFELRGHFRLEYLLGLKGCELGTTEAGHVVFRDPIAGVCGQLAKMEVGNVDGGLP